VKTAAKAFGSELRALREAKGFGLRELGKKARISPAFLSKVERGEMTPPAEKKLKSLAKVLDSNPDVLMALAGRLPDDVLKIIQRHPLQYIALLRDLRDHDAEELDRVRGSVFFDGLPTMSDRVKSPPPVGSLSEILGLDETNDKGAVPLAAVTTSNKRGLLEVVEDLRQKHEEEQGVK
jgi:transcriptional regulator with XRE-family HTH domain